MIDINLSQEIGKLAQYLSTENLKKIQSEKEICKTMDDARTYATIYVREELERLYKYTCKQPNVFVTGSLVAKPRLRLSSPKGDR